MFIVIVSGVGWSEGHDTFPASRVFEGTTPALAAQFRPGDRLKEPVPGRGRETSKGSDLRIRECYEVLGMGKMH
jgi:hypothetical protein